MEFRKDINGLRAIAVTAVVLFHMKVEGFSGGFVGVDIFFVISGFLMASIAQRELEAHRFNVWIFLFKRIRRIFPALAVVAVVCLVWGGFSYLPKDYERLSATVSRVLTFKSNIGFVGKEYFGPDAQKNLLLHTWSLSVEMQFYLAFAAFCWVIWKRSLQAGGIALVVLSVASLLWCLTHVATLPEQMFYLLPGRIWEFISGSIIAYVGGGRSLPFNAIQRKGISVVGAILLILAIIWIDPTQGYPGWQALLPVLGTALILLAEIGPVAWVLNHRPFQFLGKISYSVYLWHWPLLLVYQERFGHEPDVAATMILIAASILFGWISYQWIEKPTRKHLSVRMLAAGAVTMIVASLAFKVVLSRTDGWPERLPDYVQPTITALLRANPRMDECFDFAINSKKLLGDFCQIGAATSSEVSLLLWGDSHADQIQQPVSDIATQMGISGVVATKAGCTPGFHVATPVDSYVKCKKFSDSVFDYLGQHPQITIVVIAGYWVGYSHSKEQALKEIADILARRGGHMVLVSTVPNPTVDVPLEWRRRQIWAGHAIPDVMAPLEQEQKTIEINKRLAEIASQAGNVIVVDPFKDMCNSNGCYIVKNGQALYKDTNHLSRAGVAEITPQLSTALHQALARQGAFD
jgi:peptidoglycan/LPS O-acetylase OafA/YrhL